LKPLEDPITFVPSSPIGLPHLGQPPPISHVGMQAQDHPYVVFPLLSHDRRSTFYMKVIPIHFIKLGDTNWDKIILSPPLKELCSFFTKGISIWSLCSQYTLLSFLVRCYVNVSFSMCKSLMGIQILSMGRGKPCNRHDTC
jgi:hypothetical protein